MTPLKFSNRHPGSIIYRVNVRVLFVSSTRVVYDLNTWIAKTKTSVFWSISPLPLPSFLASAHTQNVEVWSLVDTVIGKGGHPSSFPNVVRARSYYTITTSSVPGIRKTSNTNSLPLTARLVFRYSVNSFKYWNVILQICYVYKIHFCNIRERYRCFLFILKERNGNFVQNNSRIAGVVDKLLGSQPILYSISNVAVRKI